MIFMQLQQLCCSAFYPYHTMLIIIRFPIFFSHSFNVFQY